MHPIPSPAAIPLDTNGVHSVLIWSGILIVLLLLAFGAYSYLKRWMSQTDETNRGVGFTLSDLRELHKQGKMSSEEYEMTRAKIVDAARQMTEKIPPVFPRRTEPPKARQD